MANILGWKEQTNLENSFWDFLQSALTTDDLVVLDNEGHQKTIDIRVGFENSGDWSLPIISFYEDSRSALRLSIGSNARLKTKLLIIDIRGLNDPMRSNLTDWLEEKVNDGFPYYEYTPSADPNNPDKTQNGYVSIEFLTNSPLRFGDSADLFEKYRQNISISCFIENKEN